MEAIKADFDATMSLDEIARVFLDARRSGRRLQTLSTVRPDLTLAMAEHIAALTTQYSGQETVGFKLGYTSQVMRTQMGIDSANWGVLTADMDLRISPLPILAHPRVEPEIALNLRSEVSGTTNSIEVLRDAVGSVHLALEIVDTRYRDYRFTLEDNTADGSSAAAFALGPAQHVSILEDLSTPVALFENEQVVESGRASETMGGPLNALQWLAQTFARRNLTLPAGMVVLTGGLTRAVPMKPAAIYRTAHEVLGEAMAQWPGPKDTV
jgi:2-keto-4-pentenoate hydratase